jgi:hypothetical protein
MSTLFGFLASATGAPRQSTGARLLDRLANSTQLEDRREALTEFNELTAAESVRLIDKGGMSVLVQLLREEDTQLTRDVLETLSNLMDPDVPRGIATETGEVKASHNSAVFLTHDSYLLDVLNSSEDGDLYVRFHAVQLVIKLLARARQQTQATVLNQPATVGRVLSLAEDRREIVRNEVLLLLARLGEGSAGLQNILAFQGAFDQLLGIIESEGKEEGPRLVRCSRSDSPGPCDPRSQANLCGRACAGGLGSVIVHDCLRIACTLLESASSCRFFRETGCLQRMVALLELPPAHNKGHATSATLACELLEGLLAGGTDDNVTGAETASEGGATMDASSTAPVARAKRSEDIAATQASLLKLPFVPLLVGLCTDAATATDPALRLQALATLAELVRGHPAAVAELLGTRITRRAGADRASEPALYRILYTGSRSSSAALRNTTVRLFQCMLHENSAAQRAAAAFLVGPTPTAAPPAAAPAAAPSSEADGDLDHEHAYMTLALQTLLKSGDAAGAAQSNTPGDEAVLWVAVGVLAAALYGNPDVKRMLVRLPVVLRVGDDVGIGSGSIDSGAGSAGTLLMPLLVKRTVALLQSPAEASKSLLLISLLQLLLTWLADSVDAIAAFLAPMMTLPSLVDAFEIFEGAPEYTMNVRGHLAGLLGACLALDADDANQHADGSPDTVGGAAAASLLGKGGQRVVIVKMIKQRIGLDAYGDAWDAMVASEPFVVAAAGGTQLSSRKTEDLLAAQGSLDGGLLYSPEMTALLGRARALAHAAIMEAHTLPDAAAATRAARSGVVPRSAPEGSPAALANAVLPTSTDGADVDASLDPAIESFKALIASQDARQNALLDEVRQLREQHACVTAELESARAMARRSDAHRQHADECSDARMKAEATVADTQEELRSARDQLSRATTDLEGLAAAYAQMEAALAERDAELRSIAAAGGGGGSTPVGARGGGGDDAARVAVLQAHADGLARDKASLQAEIDGMRASLAAAQAATEEAQAASEAAAQAAQAGTEAADVARGEAAAVEASVQPLRESVASLEMALRVAQEAREQAERDRDDAESALEAAAEAAAAHDILRESSDAAEANAARVRELDVALAEERTALKQLRDEQEELLILVAEQDHLLETAREEQATLRHELEARGGCVREAARADQHFSAANGEVRTVSEHGEALASRGHAAPDLSSLFS